MWDFQNTLSRRDIFISYVKNRNSRWSVSGPISDETECSNKFAMIGSNFSIPQNKLVRFTYIL